MAENVPTTEELLAMCDDAGSEVLAAAVGDWKPPDGTYTTSIEHIRATPWKNQKDGKMYPVYGVLMRILDGPESGKKFEQAFFGNSTIDMGTLKTLYALVYGGDPPDVGREFREKVTAVKDATVEIDAKRKPRKDGTGVNFNVGFLRVIGG